MKRVKEACICQTLHFMLKDDIAHDIAVRLVKEEIEKYTGQPHEKLNQSWTE